MSRVLPLLGFVLLVGVLGFGIWWNQHHETNEVPSPLIGKPAPEFTLPRLTAADETVSKRDLLGKPYLLNVFASWCITCQDEHPILSAQIKPLGIELVGLAWKDEPEDTKRWITHFGNPYDVLLVDRDGHTGIDFGVYMAPETFLIDARGIIRYKRIGMFTPDNVRDELLPKIAELQREASR